MDIDVPQTWAEAREQILPVIRRATEPANAWRVAHSDPSNAILSRPFTSFLNELAVLDLPDMRLYINNSHLELWQVDAATIHSTARDNLYPAATTGLRMRSDYNLLHLEAGDGYESSRLLLGGWLGAFKGSVEGKPLVTLPASRLVMIGGSESATQVETLLEIAWEGFRTAGGPLSPVLYTVDAHDRVIPWRPEEDHPLYERIVACERLLAAYEYSEQRDQFLDADLPEALPTVTLVRAKVTGESYTSCRWVEADGEVLLPQTDRVVLVHGETETEVDWKTIERQAAGCLEETDHRPTRYRARWPMPKTLAAITGSQSSR